MVLVPLVSHLPHSQTLVTRLVSNIQRETVLYSTHNSPIIHWHEEYIQVLAYRQTHRDITEYFSKL